MKKIILFFIIVCLLLASSWWYFFRRNPFLKDQIKYAEQYGLRIENYSGPDVFPTGYYYSILKPGMNIGQIHATIKGYETVYHCKQYSEIYYFFSREYEKAILFKVFYDEKGRYKYLEGEEPNSRTIRLDGCSEGLIDENSYK